MSADTRYASRKFILACAAFVVTLVLLCLGKMGIDLYAETLRWILALYFTGNVAMAAVTKVKNE